jgi:acetyltransferase-like isoleucine patch superfamily enzyme
LRQTEGHYDRSLVPAPLGVPAASVVVDPGNAANTVTFGTDVWIGANCDLLVGTVIGGGGIDAASSLRGVLPSGCVAFGVFAILRGWRAQQP